MIADIQVSFVKYPAAAWNYFAVFSVDGSLNIWAVNSAKSGWSNMMQLCCHWTSAFSSTCHIPDVLHL